MTYVYTLNPLTVMLNNNRVVLAKMYKGKPSAITYANRTQATRKAVEFHATVYTSGHGPFYVEVDPCESFDE